jgi:hypothetical protein
LNLPGIGGIPNEFPAYDCRKITYRFFFAFSTGILYAGFATLEVAEWIFKKN